MSHLLNAKCMKCWLGSYVTTCMAIPSQYTVCYSPSSANCVSFSCNFVSAGCIFLYTLSDWTELTFKHLHHLISIWMPQHAQLDLVWWYNFLLSWSHPGHPLDKQFRNELYIYTYKYNFVAMYLIIKNKPWGFNPAYCWCLYGFMCWHIC